MLLPQALSKDTRQPKVERRCQAFFQYIAIANISTACLLGNIERVRSPGQILEMHRLLRLPHSVLYFAAFAAAQTAPRASRKMCEYAQLSTTIRRDTYHKARGESMPSGSNRTHQHKAATHCQCQPIRVRAVISLFLLQYAIPE